MAPDSAGAEAAFEQYQRALVDLFAESPEGQERLKADPDMGFWAAQLMYYAYQYEGTAIPEMTLGDVQTVVTDLFPRKISLQSPEQADDAIPELTAFWQYLKREFRLPRADAVLEFLRDVEPDFPEMMNDPSDFGMVKSFVAMGHAAGFDMTTREGLKAFMLAFNAGRLAPRTRPEPPTPRPSYFDGPSGPNPATKRSEKRKRKQAAEARKRNRKRRK